MTPGRCHAGRPSRRERRPGPAPHSLSSPRLPRRPAARAARRSRSRPTRSAPWAGRGGHERAVDVAVLDRLTRGRPRRRSGARRTRPSWAASSASRAAAGAGPATPIGRSRGSCREAGHAKSVSTRATTTGIRRIAAGGTLWPCEPLEAVSVIRSLPGSYREPTRSGSRLRSSPYERHVRIRDGAPAAGARPDHGHARPDAHAG